MTGSFFTSARNPNLSIIIPPLPPSTVERLPLHAPTPVNSSSSEADIQQMSVRIVTEDPPQKKPGARLASEVYETMDTAINSEQHRRAQDVTVHAPATKRQRR